MIQAGDIHLADLGRERRHPVLVVSTDRFHRVSDRVLVAPQIDVESDEVLAPWIVEVAGAWFAIDLVRSVAAVRLLDRTGRASQAEHERARRALRHIT